MKTPTRPEPPAPPEKTMTPPVAPEPPEPPGPPPEAPAEPLLATKRAEWDARRAEAKAGWEKAKAEWAEARKMLESRPPLRPPQLPNPLVGLRERRAQRQKLVAELIAENKSLRSQAELQELLEQRGLLVTQSSVSRDLRDLGVRRVKGVYVIKPSREGGWSFDDVIELVEMVTRSGPYTTVIQTVPDAAKLVARTLEEAGWEEVVGTVAGDDTIFVATRTEEEQDQLFQRFKKYLSV